jgi:pheromone shutdown protein TraB
LIEELAPGVVVVGTAHVSPTSVAEVEATIRARRPAKVLIELDPRRLAALQDPDAWRKTDIVQVIKEGKQHLFLLQLYLASVQARMGRETGVAPGTELLRAVQVAQEVGAEVVLVDRDVGMTLRRAFDGMTLQERAGLTLNVFLEMLPDTGPAAPDDPTPAWTELVLPAAAIAILALLPALRDRFLSGVDLVLDVLLGYPSVPGATIALLGAVGGYVLASSMQGKARRTHWSRPAASMLWTALLVGVLASWAWGFMDGASPAFLRSMLPGPTSVAAGAAGLAAWFLLGGLVSFRVARVVLRVLAQRAAMTKEGTFDVEALLHKDAITQMTEEFARFAPGIKRVLIDERDAYMASHIAELARLGHQAEPSGACAGAGAGLTASGAAGPGTPAQTAGWQSGEIPAIDGPRGGVVAVVGAGHMPGIRHHFATARPQDRIPLEALPAPRLTIGKVLAWALPLALVGVFVWLGYRGYQEGNFQDLLASLGWFVLITSTCAAAGAAIALAHPWSIAAAFASAPVATLHPLIAAGWFAGLVEAKVRTPTVADFEAIKTLQTMREFWRNGVVRILIVTALTNLGSSAGFFIASGKVLGILQGGA